MSKPDTMFSDTSVLWNMFSADILDTCPSISRTLMTSDDCFFLWHQHHHYLLVCWILVCLIQCPGLCLPHPVLVSEALSLTCTFDSILWMSSIMSDSCPGFTHHILHDIFLQLPFRHYGVQTFSLTLISSWTQPKFLWHVTLIKMLDPI